jgi:hypothetical protein
MSEQATLPIREARLFLADKDVEFSERNIEVAAELQGPSERGVRKGYLLDCIEKAGLLDEFIEQCWPSGRTSKGTAYISRYRSLKERNDQLLEIEIGDGEETSDEVLFGLEHQLRDFIAQNISAIDMDGKRLTLYRDDAGRCGTEYPTAVGPIDILAVDRNGEFYVFELKRGRTPDKAIGQLARYMGWVRQSIGRGCGVNGVIVAREISENLRYAVSVVPNVYLFEYKVEFSLNRVDGIA